MRTICFFFAYFFVVPLSIAQNTYSYRFDFGFPATVLTNVVATDSAYYLLGVMADSVPPYKKSNLFLKASLEGEIQIIKTLRDTAKTYETWFGNLAFNSEGHLVASGYSFDSTSKSLLLAFNTEGDTIFTATNPHPAYPEVKGVLNHDFKVLNDGYILVNEINNPDGTGDIDIELLKLDTAGRFIWSQTFGITSRNDTPHSVLVIPDGYIVVSIRDNINVAHQNIEARNLIFKVNEQGDILWQYSSPPGELRGKEGRAIATSDGGLLVLTGQGVEVPAGPGFSQLRWHNYAFKLDSNRQEEWGVLVRDSLPAIPSVNQFSSAVELGNNEGYVVAGNLAEYHSDRSWHVGVLGKIDSNGELIWQRHFQHLEGAWTRHYINDLAESPGGGFILAGEVRDTVNAPRQQGWLLKVDEYGCLVPGCELLQSAGESAGDSKSPADLAQLLLYPNPVAEALQVYFSAPSGGEHHFRILDAQGREWQRFSTRLPEVTLLVEVGELPGGVYYLQCLREGTVVKMERFVKR